MITQAYIDTLAKCLVEGAEDPTTPAHKRMCDLIRADVSLRLPPYACQEAYLKSPTFVGDFRGLQYSHMYSHCT